MFGVKPYIQLRVYNIYVHNFDTIDPSDTLKPYYLSLLLRDTANCEEYF